MLPVPVPDDAVTEYTDPEPDTDLSFGPLMPLPTTRVKPPMTTPVTLSLKVTVHETVEAFVGLGPARLIDTTCGGVVSIVHVTDVAELVCEPDTARTLNVCDPAESGPE
jgi:hypothetical protein